MTPLSPKHIKGSPATTAIAALIIVAFCWATWLDPQLLREPEALITLLLGLFFLLVQDPRRMNRRK